MVALICPGWVKILDSGGGFKCPGWVKILDSGGGSQMPRLGKDTGLRW